eukprot:TRINITY_DN561_c0_g1_i7.p2 TRINITY_DN561_c0_g1~~TRINITY_DN561_c0_g1_i7.p2  ORF type:complete len:176 (-),score=21.73 TRINITY_DN561_c0_g1_i7:62-589(-)
MCILSQQPSHTVEKQWAQSKSGPTPGVLQTEHSAGFSLSASASRMALFGFMPSVTHAASTGMCVTIEHVAHATAQQCCCCCCSCAAGTAAEAAVSGLKGHEEELARNWNAITSSTHERHTLCPHCPHVRAARTTTKLREKGREGGAFCAWAPTKTNDEIQTTRAPGRGGECGRWC